MAVHKEIKAIIKEVRRQGYRVGMASGAGSHCKVIAPDGRQVARLGLGGSGDPKDIARKVRADLRRAGIDV